MKYTAGAKRTGISAAVLIALLSISVAWAEDKTAPPDSSHSDVTVYCKYHFMNGDTLSRPTYYGDGRVRMTLSDANEIIYDVRSKSVVYLNHEKKTFWKGPLDRANALVDSLSADHFQAFMNATPEERQKWAAYVDKFNTSLESEVLEHKKKISGRYCDGYQISAGKIMVHTRWINRDILLTDYVKDLERIAILPTVDPAGRAIVGLITKAEKGFGLTLGASTKIDTPTQKGTYSWEAYSIDTRRPIPDSVWQIPEGYAELKL
jgi:hypothetical protein